MSRAWAGGSTRAYRKTRAAVLVANAITHRGACVLALPGVCAGRATQAHHVLGRGVTGDDPRYMVGACGPCNRAVGEPEPDPEPMPRTRW